MLYALQLKNIRKTFNGEEIINDLNINIKEGEIYGFIGPNGAGKTTVMKMIMNHWKPTEGTIELFGKKITPESYEMLGQIGSIIEFPVFYEHLSGESNLYLHCEYMGYSNRNSIDNVIDLLELTEVSKKSVQQYSLGMKQRLGIARAILTKPKLLILDEPTNGLDPIGVKQLRNLFSMLKRELGMTIMVSSHILSEIEKISDTVGIIHHGKLLKEISLKEIEQANAPYIHIVVQDTLRTAQVLRKFVNDDSFKILDNGNIYIYDNKAESQEIFKAIFQQGIEIFSIEKKSENLEDYFIRLIGKGGKGG